MKPSFEVCCSSLHDFSLGLYFILSFFGSVLVALGFMSRTILNLKNLPNVVRNFFDHTTEVMVSEQKGRVRIIAVIIWVAVAIGFFEGYVYIPGTHIYNYLLPTFILMGFGMSERVLNTGIPRMSSA